LFPLSESAKRFRSAKVKVTHCPSIRVLDVYIHLHNLHQKLGSQLRLIHSGSLQLYCAIYICIANSLGE